MLFPVDEQKSRTGQAPIYLTRKAATQAAFQRRNRDVAIGYEPVRKCRHVVQTLGSDFRCTARNSVMHGFELTCGRMVAGSGADFGIPKADIAKVLETDPRKFVSSLPGAGHRPNQDNTRVAENLFRRAIGDGRESVTAAIFWLKTRAGWRRRRSTSSMSRCRWSSRSLIQACSN